MKRRECIAHLGGVAALSLPWPLAARAQQSDRMRRVGVVLINGQNEAAAQARIEALRKSLAELGWSEGKNLQLDIRAGAGVPTQAQAYARELVASMPDVIFAEGTPVLTAVKAATRDIPVVFVAVTDPVGAGFVQSLPHPGGNITGFSTFEPEIGGKWLELLKKVAPRLKRAAGIVDPAFKGFAKHWRAIEDLAPRMELKLTTIAFHDRADDIERSLKAFATSPDGGLIVLPTAINNVARDRIFGLATRYRLPAIYPFSHFAQQGGLMSYGFDTLTNFPRAAGYIDRILKGTKPSELPVQAPTKYDLVINLKAAKAIGLDVPPTLLARADEVIE
jgi:putative tryptophan/tyrosine transport system substrate-binding protein